MKHARFLDGDRDNPAPEISWPLIAQADAEILPQRHGFGRVSDKPRSLALLVTIGIHALLIGGLLAQRGYQEMGAVAAPTTLATFDVGAAPSEASEPPEPPAITPSDTAPPAIELPETIMPAPKERPVSRDKPETAVQSPSMSSSKQSGELPADPHSAAQEKAQAKAERTDSNPPATASKKASDAYGSAVIAHLRRFRRPNAIGPGSTTIRFTISPSGGVSSASVASSSGSKRFDREALDMVRRAAPFPKPPPGVNRDFSFEVKGQ